MKRASLGRGLWLAMGLASTATTAAAQPATPELVVYAAGSLRAALTEVGRRFEAAPGGSKVRFVFGASGLLKDRLLAGEPAEVFASANLEHPQALAAAGKAGAVQRFARNRLCLLARPDARVTGDNLLARLLDPAVRVGTSTPGADPSGDYTWDMFRKLAARGGDFGAAYETLDRKALRLTGGPTSPPPPAGRSVYGALLETGQADVFVTYCTNALQAQQDVPTLQKHELPDDVNVAASYGVVRLVSAGAGAQRFVDLLLGPDGQTVLRSQGFAAP